MSENPLSDSQEITSVKGHSIFKVVAMSFVCFWLLWIVNALGVAVLLGLMDKHPSSELLATVISLATVGQILIILDIIRTLESRQ